jgi:multidrug efflux pump subunit AcrA (membrane-fusion protein)
MRFFRRSLTGLFIFALTLGLLAMAANTLRSAYITRSAQNTPARPPAERVFSANLTLATPAPFTPVITAYGETLARRSLELRSPRPGTVLSLGQGIGDGAAVTAGQLILTLDPADATTTRDLARSDLARAEGEVRDAAAALTLATADVAAAQTQADLRATALARQRDLEQRRASTTAAVETAALAASAADQAVLSRRAALQQATARVDQATTALTRQKITLNETERALRDTKLFAAFTGVLSDFTTVPGRILATNERVADLIDPTALEVSFRLSTAQFSRLLDANGTLSPAPLTASLDVSGADITATGQIDRAGAAVGAGQTGRLLYATLTAAPGFRPGDFVTIRISEPTLPRAIALPATALGADNTVLALTDDDRLQSIPVQLLRRSGDDVLLAPDGIANREIVRERSPLLGAGIKINPIRSTDTAPTNPDQAALITLTPERRAALIAYVTANTRMPDDAKTRILAQLAADQVPARVIERLESRMGG